MVRLFAFVGILAALGGAGMIALASWNIPAPTARVEKVLPDEAFPR